MKNTNPNLPDPVRKTVKVSPQRSKRRKKRKPCTAKTCVGMSHTLRSVELRIKLRVLTKTGAHKHRNASDIESGPSVEEAVHKITREGND